MSKRQNKFLKNITITKRVTLMCGFFFTAAVFLISILVFVNLYFSYRSITRSELNDAVEKVSEYIKNGGDISKETLSEVNTNKFIEIEVYELPPMYMDKPDKFRGGIREVEQDWRRVSAEMPAFAERDAKITFEKLVDFGFTQEVAFQGDKMYMIRAMRVFSREKKILSAFAVLFVIVNICGIIGAFGTGHYIAKKMLKPISDMTQLASKISMEDINSRIGIDGPDDEIRQLGITFNNMLDRLADSFEEQQRFISDASHELRTPISVIQGYVNLLDRWGKDDPEILTESIESIKTETEHMSRLVKKLLYLASENQKQKVSMKPISLNECVRNVEREFSVMELPHTLEVIEKGNFTVMADEDLIRQLIWVFLENSMKYCKNGKADIVVSLYEDNGVAALSIKDNGIGINKEDLPHVFERFFRSDKSRSKTIPGTGLGLSIAHEIINRHNGKIIVESERDKGCEFIVYLNIGLL